ncbi:MoeZ/MoeB [Artemisia annua]|uniref:Adenylyltransferase and sulfurtransferase MOCS3 n=1 Tax=Artemisia annua TaxID=35608 RepID=A0A2U1LSM2_ARTAN|nr:MoeZ/MoeB [Artemisia annua]
MESNGCGDYDELVQELKSLKDSKRDIEARISVLETQLKNNKLNDEKVTSDCCSNNFGEHGLTADSIYRYSRQLLLPSFGVQAQSNLLKSSILVIGAGGLGSPALLYLAACGVGRLGMVDHDVVELNNLHRQIIHGEAYIGRSKVESAAAACRSINSTIEVVEHREALRTSNALEIVSKYDIVIDATDNAPSRYLISDCCVLLGKPLVSGAALGLEGQLAVYNYKGGPCYRCLFPTPPPTTACQRCSDSGVLGVVPGVIGCLQALEAIKVASLVGEPLSERMLLFDALSARIRIVKIRGRSSQCEACGENATLTQDNFQQFDYENFTQSPLSAPYWDYALSISINLNDRKIMESNGCGDYDELVKELKSLKDSKRDIEARISVIETQLKNNKLNEKVTSDCCSNNFGEHGLTADSIYRYSRQLLLPSFGVQAQSNLLKSSILVIGAGGLGSPALLYLAACGVGRLGMVDHDVVELNNLHRQIIHGEAYIGRSKVESAAAACRSINSTIEVVEHREALRTSNALEIVSKYDIVIDATDNAPSRYLISDCCVLLGKPLVSGAALGLEGQLAVYNYKGGPCYRCLFPTPPPTTACQRCSDSGVLGVVPGVIGCLQALEAIKVASLVGEPLSERMLLFDALSARIRIVKIRGRSSQCEACGENATLTQDNFQQFDYENFTQSPLSAAPLKLKLLTPDSRISSKEYSEVVEKGEPHILIDVRPSHHYKIVSLPNSLNVPLASLEGRLPEISSALDSTKANGVHDGSDARLYVVCRRGNDSQRAVDLLHKAGFTSAKDIVGGLESWAHDVDQRFPTY